MWKRRLQVTNLQKRFEDKACCGGGASEDFPVTLHVPLNVLTKWSCGHIFHTTIFFYVKATHLASWCRIWDVPVEGVLAY